MKLLICVTSLCDIEPALKHYNAALSKHAGMKYLSSAKILHHEVDILETGLGVFQTTYKLTKVLGLQKYHLALNLCAANAYTAIEPGTILNIVNEKPGDYGTLANGEWKDFYDTGMMKREDEPHVRGGFVNLNNSYMNVFIPFKKVVGVSVSHYADKSNYEVRRDKYKAECETIENLGFVYTCLYEKQNYYSLCVIERSLATNADNSKLAAAELNKTLIYLIEKL